MAQFGEGVRRRGWRRAAWAALAWPLWVAAANEEPAEADDARDAAQALGQVELPWRAAPPSQAQEGNRPLPCPPGAMKSRLLGLPVYGTLPNEGSTFGAIPILLRVCSTDQKTHNIYAPSLSYNAALGLTGTARWFGFLPRSQTLTATGSWSQHTNRGALLAWDYAPRELWAPTFDASVEVQQSIFFRFFGVGPDSRLKDESNQARRRLRVGLRGAVNLPHHLSFGLCVRGNVQETLAAHIASLTPSRARFPTTPGVFGSSGGLSLLADLRYDSRPERDFAARGLFAEVQGGTFFGVVGSPTHMRLRAEVRGLWSARPWLSGAWRGRIHYVDRSEVPFYYLSALGGGVLGRGFIEDRFLDRGAWQVEHELRLRLAETHLLGVTVDWRVDPFVWAGQVFHDVGALASHLRLAAGIGLRAWLKPNVVGRIDIAYAGEGIAPYVELGYPF